MTQFMKMTADTRTKAFGLVPPAMIVLITLFWLNAPASWVDNPLTTTAVSVATLMFIQLLELVAERHVHWRMYRLEFLTDLFYAVLFYAVISGVEDQLAEAPLTSAKHALGITTDWALHSPFLVQVALVIFVVEFGQYWMHRLMHNSFVWWTHAPHHHITQLNAAKGLVGNPLELFLVSLSVIAVFDLRKDASFCAFNILGIVSTFAHANVRCNTPRWYGYVFTTIEAHSLHHSVPYNDTRCNYANSLILIDRVFGTFREGEASIVGQDDRQRLSILQQFLFPLRPLIAALKGRAKAPELRTRSLG
jgi:sterol desaturase/sphingolipid hydroxylase (fatty acid hydroxylase superfamily)